MCAIAGVIDPSRSQTPAELQRTISRMTDTLRHRGPDDEGAWVDARSGLALGHRRLAILDLSPLGHQPMLSRDSRYVLVFNGEIYNFKVLRAQLEELGHVFAGHSDTEVMLAAICQWGLEQALERFVGMFAFGLWDRQQRSLYLARDRMGEKPLYYGWCGRVFLFGSELKALRVHPNWQGEIDREALALFIRHNYIPGPRSIYQNIYKLPAGCLLQLTEADTASRELPEPKPYWSLQAVVAQTAEFRMRGAKTNESEAIEELHDLLRQSIAQQMVADVPLGAFLSGGIDSSTIVALMQHQSRRPIKTFSIGFDDPTYNEAHFAKTVAQHLRTDHTELYVSANELGEVIPRLPALYDEPFSDTSQIPTTLLCELARQEVTVSLSGDAGDELFGGYELYAKSERAWSCIGWLPKGVRSRCAAVLRLVSASPVPVSPRSFGHFLNRVANLAAVLPARDERLFYRAMISQCREPDEWLLTPNECKNGEWGGGASDFLHRMMYSDSVSYLPDDILVKVDRAAMSVSLETRMPFLDHRIVELAWRLPASLKRRGGAGKWILRQVLYQYVPAALVERPKKGFAVPIAEWLRGPLREWAEDLLSEKRLRSEGFFRTETIRQKWSEHLSRKRDWGQALWNVLMFETWLEQSTESRLPNAECRFTERPVLVCQS